MNATIRKPDHTTITVPAKVELLWWQEKGLSYTASGYGGKIPSQYKVQIDGRWQRVYVAQYSNAGTSYIMRGGVWWIVDDIG